MDIDNREILAQLMEKQTVTENNTTFHCLQSDSCIYYSCWKCPNEIFTLSKLHTPTGCYNHHHEAHFPLQYNRLINEYIKERKDREPEWDGKTDGDPWGYEYELLKFLEAEIKYVDTHRFDFEERPDVYLETKVNDDAYNKLSEEITLLTIEADRVVENDEEVKKVLNQLASLEYQRHQLFTSLVIHQINMNANNSNPSNPNEVENHENINNTDKTNSNSVDTFEQNCDNNQQIVDLVSLKLNEVTALEATHIMSKWKLSPCQICGGLLSTVDGIRKLADHIVGKLHTCHAALNIKAAELKKIKPLSPETHPWALWGEAEREKLNEKVRITKQKIIHKDKGHIQNVYIDVHKVLEDTYQTIPWTMDPRRCINYDQYVNNIEQENKRKKYNDGRYRHDRDRR